MNGSNSKKCTFSCPCTFDFPFCCLREPQSASDLLEDVCAERESVDSVVLEQVVTLAVELAREGRERRKVGTIFTVGDAEAVLAHSQPMILDPLACHDDEARRVDDPNSYETLTEVSRGSRLSGGDGCSLVATPFRKKNSLRLSIPAFRTGSYCRTSARSRRRGPGRSGRWAHRRAASRGRTRRSVRR